MKFGRQFTCETFAVRELHHKAIIQFLARFGIKQTPAGEKTVCRRMRTSEFLNNLTKLVLTQCFFPRD
jgi:hypothetical protein